MQCQWNVERWPQRRPNVLLAMTWISREWRISIEHSPFHSATATKTLLNGMEMIWKEGERKKNVFMFLTRANHRLRPWLLQTVDSVYRFITEIEKSKSLFFNEHRATEYEKGKKKRTNNYLFAGEIKVFIPKLRLIQWKYIPNRSFIIVSRRLVVPLNVWIDLMVLYIEKKGAKNKTRCFWSD